MIDINYAMIVSNSKEEQRRLNSRYGDVMRRLLRWITENEIQTMLDSIISGEKMTVIVIAHRLRAVKECDKCFLMQNGRITHTGSLEDIMKVYK